MLPLGTDIEEGTIVISVHDGYTYTKTQLEVFGTILSINIIIRCGVACSQPVTDMVENTSCTTGIGNPLCSHIKLITVLEQTTSQAVTIATESREINTSPLLISEVSTHTQSLVVVDGQTYTNGRRKFQAVGNGIGRSLCRTSECSNWH